MSRPIASGRRPRGNPHLTAAHGWRDQGVYYQIYPRSWADSDGDGVGDLRGIAERLDYLQWLGIDGIWLNPIMPSPNADWGYDVVEYCDVHPELGTLADCDELIREAHARGIRVVLDLVPAHTSDRHPWFQEARASRTSPRRDWYVWADARPDGGPPNNWRALLGGGSAWKWEEHTRQYSLHTFLPQQRDLNWWNPAVRSAFDDILRFWFDRGVDGFRIDVVHHLIRDRNLRDNPLAGPEDHPEVRRIGLRPVFTQDRPEVHEILRRWHALGTHYEPERILIGETYLFDLARLGAYFGEHSDELTLTFNFPFFFADFRALDLAGIVETTERLVPPAAWTTWSGSNHDVGRFPSRWAGDDERKTRCALLMLLTLRGTPFLYYGDEIGMTDVDVSREQLRDPAGVLLWPEPGRDRCRTPMQWSAAPGAGFTRPGVTPWLPLGPHRERNVADQRGDPDSTLTLCRDLIALRRRSEDARVGAYERVALDDGLWVWRRGLAIQVCLNLSDAERTLEAEGTIAAATAPGRRGTRVRSAVTLAPWEGVVLEAT